MATKRAGVRRPIPDCELCNDSGRAFLPELEDVGAGRAGQYWRFRPCKCKRPDKKVSSERR